LLQAYNESWVFLSFAVPKIRQGILS